MSDADFDVIPSIETRQGEPLSCVHVMPQYDVRKHERSIFCWCRPREISRADIGACPVISHNLWLDPDADDAEYVM